MALYKEYKLIGRGTTNDLAGADLGRKFADVLIAEGFTIGDVSTTQFLVQIMGYQGINVPIKLAASYSTSSKLSSLVSSMYFPNGTTTLPSSGYTYFSPVLWRGTSVQFKFRLYHLKGGGMCLTPYSYGSDGYLSDAPMVWTTIQSISPGESSRSVVGYARPGFYLLVPGESAGMGIQESSYITGTAAYGITFPDPNYWIISPAYFTPGTTGTGGTTPAAYGFKSDTIMLTHNKESPLYGEILTFPMNGESKSYLYLPRYSGTSTQRSIVNLLLELEQRG